MNVLSQKISPIELRKIKDTAKANLKESHAFPKGLTHVALVAIADESARNFVLEGLSAIGIGNVAIADVDATTRRYAAAVETVAENDLYAYDFFVYDGEMAGLDVVKCMKAGVTPIMPDRNIFSGILSDFNPMKFEGNGFFYKSGNPYCIFERIVAYVENVKFPEDRRILLKNVAQTF